MHANRLIESDPMELVPVLNSDGGTLYFEVSDEYSDTAAIYVQIDMNGVYIAENVGGGLSVFLVPQLSQNNVRLRLKKVLVVHNFLVQGRYVVRFDKIMTSTGSVYISLELVEISNSVLLFQDESAWSQKLFDVTSDSCGLSLQNTEVHLKQTGIFSNKIPAVCISNGDLHFHGVNVFRNNTGRRCGGALVLQMNSHIYLHRGAQVYILENIALEHMEEKYVLMMVHLMKYMMCASIK